MSTVEPFAENTMIRAFPHPGIYHAMVALMAEIGYVGKERKSDYGNYKFRGIDDVMAALQPALVKCGVVVIPEVLSHEMSQYPAKNSTMYRAVVKVKYTFYSQEDGSSVSAVVMGEGADVADKAYNKAMAGAMKYAITQALSIPTIEPKDSEDSVHDAAAQGAGVKPRLDLGNFDIATAINAAQTVTEVAKILNEKISKVAAREERMGLTSLAQARIKELKEPVPKESYDHIPF